MIGAFSVSLHHGHNGADAFLDATWLTSSVVPEPGLGPDAGSEDITLYK